TALPVQGRRGGRLLLRDRGLCTLSLRHGGGVGLPPQHGEESNVGSCDSDHVTPPVPRPLAPSGCVPAVRTWSVSNPRASSRVRYHARKPGIPSQQRAPPGSV